MPRDLARRDALGVGARPSTDPRLGPSKNGAVAGGAAGKPASAAAKPQASRRRGGPRSSYGRARGIPGERKTADRGRASLALAGDARRRHADCQAARARATGEAAEAWPTRAAKPAA